MPRQNSSKSSVPSKPASVEVEREARADARDQAVRRWAVRSRAKLCKEVAGGFAGGNVELHFGSLGRFVGELVDGLGRASMREEVERLPMPPGCAAQSALRAVLLGGHQGEALVSALRSCAERTGLDWDRAVVLFDRIASLVEPPAYESVPFRVRAWKPHAAALARDFKLAEGAAFAPGLTPQPATDGATTSLAKAQQVLGPSVMLAGAQFEWALEAHPELDPCKPSEAYARLVEAERSGTLPRELRGLKVRATWLRYVRASRQSEEPDLDRGP